MSVDMTVEDAIEIMNNHIERWYKLELESSKKGAYNTAQSYKDMAYAGEAIIIEIERELYK